MNRYFYSEESGRVLELATGNRLTVLVELFQTSPSDKPFVTVNPGMFKGMDFKVNVDVPVPDEPKEKKGKAEKSVRPTKRKKGIMYCKNCGKPGHMRKTCPGKEEEKSENAEEAIEQMRFKPISPEKLLEVKNRLKAGESCEDVADAVDMDVERIERMKVQLGL